LYSLALKTNGTLWGWGFNENYQLGTGNTSIVTSPVQIGTDTDWATISAHSLHSLGIKQDGSLWGWGDGSYYSMGCLLDFSTPVKLGCIFTSTSAPEKGDDVQLFPNPVGNQLQLLLPRAGAHGYEVRNALGQLVISMQPAQENVPLAVDVHDLTSGWYQLTIYTRNGPVVKPFIKA
jgi:hypothetical protein